MELNEKVEAIVNSIKPLNYFLSLNNSDNDEVIKQYKLYIQVMCGETAELFENLPEEYKQQVSEILQEEISTEEQN